MVDDIRTDFVSPSCPARVKALGTLEFINIKGSIKVVDIMSLPPLFCIGELLLSGGWIECSCP